MTDDRLRGLVGAWSLDAVTDAERAEIESYLAGDADARAEATELADTAARLADGVPAVQPPPALKVRLLDAIAQTPQVPAETAAEPVEPADPAGVDAAEPVRSPARETIASRSIAPEGRVYRFTRRTAAMFALAAAALIGITVGGIALQNRPGVSTEASAISALRSADDARTARASLEGGGHVEVIWSAEQHRSAITLTDVAPAPSGHTYQLWYMDKQGRPVSAGTFSTTGGEQSVLLDGRYRSGDTIGMTVEPKGGSEKPTTEPLLAVATA